MLTENQIILLGLLASVVTYVLRALSNWFGYKPGRGLVNTILFAIAAGFAVAWSGASFPDFPKPADVDVLVYAQALWTWLNNLVALGSPIMGSAGLIYNLLYDRVAIPEAVKKLLQK